MTIPFPGPRRAVIIGDEPRLALIADIETPHGVARVASTHLSFLPGFNLGQLRRLTRYLEHGTPPTLIMGDLNLPGGIPAAITGYRPLARHRTYPAVHPLVQLDHLLLKGELGQVRHTAALRSRCRTTGRWWRTSRTTDGSGRRRLCLVPERTRLTDCSSARAAHSDGLLSSSQPHNARTDDRLWFRW